MQSPDKKSIEAPKRVRTRGGRRRRREIKSMLFGGLDSSVKYDKNYDAPSDACLNCWSREHKHKDCLNPKTEEYCCNCGRRGFAVDECPRCARAFRALDHKMKSWICYVFFDGEMDKTSSIETTPKEKSQEEENWDDDHCDGKRITLIKKESREGAKREDHGDNDYCRKAAATKDKLSELKNEDFGWELSKPCHSRETTHAESGKRTTDKNSLRENSLVSIADIMKKREEMWCSTGDPLRDFLRLFHAVKHLSIDTQNEVVLQFVAERKKQMDETGAKLSDASKSS